MATSRTRRVTLKEVARMSQVSLAVAWVVLNDRKDQNVRCSEATRARVLSVADQLGYRPNRTVANFRRKQHGTIGLLVRHFEVIPHRLVPALIKAARRYDQLVVVEQHSEDEPWPKIVQEDCVDGVILFEDVETDLLNRIQRLPVSLVQVNTNQRDAQGCITYDEEQATRLAVEEFARDGRQQIVFHVAARYPNHYSIESRFRGLANACEQAGLAPPLRFDWSPKDEDGFVKWLNRYPSVDGVLLCSDRAAIRLYDELQAAGRKVPDEISVIGFNDTLASQCVRPALTSLSVDAEKVAEEAVRMLNGLIGGQAKVRHAVMPYQLKRRASTGCPLLQAVK